MGWSEAALSAMLCDRQYKLAHQSSRPGDALSKRQALWANVWHQLQAVLREGTLFRLAWRLPHPDVSASQNGLCLEAEGLAGYCCCALIRRTASLSCADEGCSRSQLRLKLGILPVQA